MASRDNAQVELARFVVTGSVLCGVQVAEGGVMDLRDGEVTYNLIGANVQTADFDVNRLVDNVVYRNNERDFDSAFMPIPDPALPPF